ncbi:MAG TPA: hypothetical protein VNO70_03070, partial [Blastocatellia bacterium]|nr:hypothetical protein [Blastocatellia bacterium]
MFFQGGALNVLGRTEAHFCRRAGLDVAQLGELREMVFATDRMTFLIRPITQEYFLLFALNPGGNVGRARYELR